MSTRKVNFIWELKAARDLKKTPYNFTEIHSAIRKFLQKNQKKKSITRVITFVGNKYTHQLTAEGHSVLRIELEDFSGNKRYAEYSSFSLADVTDNYRIQVTGYTGDAGMWHHYALKFISFLRRTWKTFIRSCVTCTNINYSLLTIVRISL